MKTEDLKTGFWGYKKFSVYQYITELEEDFSEKLLAKDEAYREELERERQRVQRLESELADLRGAYDEQRQEQKLIADTLVEARRYAEQLKEETERQEQMLRRQLQEAFEGRSREIERYGGKVRQLREQLTAILQDMDRTTEQFLQEVTDVEETAPEQNLSLFRRRTEPAAV